MFSGAIDFSDVIYSFAIGSAGAIMFVLVAKYEPEGPVARILKFLVLFVSSVAIMHKRRAWAVLAGVSADASRVSHGPTPHHLREQERRERPFGLSTGDTPQTEASLSRPDSMITFKLSRDRVFRQRVSIYIRHDLAAYLVDHCALHCSDLPIVGAVYRRAFHFIAADQGCGFAS